MSEDLQERREIDNVPGPEGDGGPMGGCSGTGIDTRSVIRWPECVSLLIAGGWTWSHSRGRGTG